MEIDKENSIEELKQELEELYRTQQARLDTGADDLDIREEIAEVEEEIKELQDETIEENSIKNERSSIEEDIKILEEFKTNGYSILLMKYGDRIKTNFKLEKAIEHILSNYKRVLKENEELKIIKSAIQTLQINSLEEEKYIVISKGSFLDGSYKHLLDDYIPIQKVKDKIEKEKLPLVIVGGRRNKRTLEYGIKLGRRQALQELLGSEE